MVYVIYPRCYEAEPSNPKGITYTTTSEGGQMTESAIIWNCVNKQL